MADTTKIEWTDATWNPITGCTIVSPGCTNCYAMGLAGTRMKNHWSREGLTQPSKAGPVWNGKVRFNAQWLTQPLHWRKPRMIFVCAHGDLFHEDVPFEWIDRVFAVMALCPQHTFQVLTKRADRMREYMLERWQGTSAMEIEGVSIPAGPETGRHYQIEKHAAAILEDSGLDDPDKDALWTDDGRLKAMQFAWPLPNVWLGVSVEDQTRADERIPALLATPAAVRFVSAEPLLGPVDLFERGNGHSFSNWLTGTRWHEGPGLNKFERGQPKLDWVIVGGESGKRARPMHPDWVRSIRDQCQDARTAFFFKQWGEWGHWSKTRLIAGKDFPMHDKSKRLHVGLENGNTGGDPAMPQDATMYRTGKKAAGRLLDGREWSEMPEVRV